MPALPAKMALILAEAYVAVQSQQVGSIGLAAQTGNGTMRERQGIGEGKKEKGVSKIENERAWTNSTFILLVF